MKLLSNEKFATRGVTLDEAARKIKLVAMDIDGTLTDGFIYYRGDSTEELKAFNVHDGTGVTMLLREGLVVGALTGRQSAANEIRCAELHMKFLEQRCWNKRETLERVAASFGFALEECLFLGDDLIDADAIRHAGIGVAVGDAEEECRAVADLQTDRRAGHGALREVATWLIKAQGKWDSELQHYHLPTGLQTT